jgi:TRAP-type C4-dicarboxylate transport system permease small subunit
MSVFYDGLVKVLIVFCSILTALMTLLICANVLLRYFSTGMDLPWVVEVTPWMLFYVTFLGAGWLLREEGHVKVDLVVDRISPRKAALIAAVTSIFCAILFFVLGCYSMTVVWDDFQNKIVTMTALIFPRFIILLALPIGCFLLTIEFIRRTGKHIAIFTKKEQHGKEAREQISV